MGGGLPPPAHRQQLYYRKDLFMLVLRLHQYTVVVFKDKVTGKKLAQILISEKSNVDYIDLSFDAVDSVAITREKIVRKIEEIS